MLGLMQDWPLLCHRIIDHAAIQHGNREVVSRSIEGPIHRTNYRDVRARALKVAQRLEKEGVKLGDQDRKSTRLNSSHGYISYAAFCLKKKNICHEPALCP